MDVLSFNCIVHFLFIWGVGLLVQYIVHFLFIWGVGLLFFYRLRHIDRMWVIETSPMVDQIWHRLTNNSLNVWIDGQNMEGDVTKFTQLSPDPYRMFWDFMFQRYSNILPGTVPANISIYIYIYIYIKNLIVLERERERERERVTLHEVVNLRTDDRCQLRIYINLQEEIFLLNW